MEQHFDDIAFDSIDSSIFSKHDGSKCIRIWNPLYKLLLKYPAKFTRLLLQFGDLYFFIELLCFTLQFFLILITSTARLAKWKIIILFIFFFLFSFLFGNPLTISLWEFVQMRWFNNSNPFQTVTSIFETSNSNKCLFNTDFTLNILFGVIFWIYVLSILISDDIFDIITSIFLFFMPCIKSVVIYFCYFIRAVQAIFDHSKIDNLQYYDPFVLSMKNEKFEFISQIITKLSINKIDGRHYNLKNYGEMEISIKRYIFMLIKEIGMIFGLIYLIYLPIQKHIKWYNMIIPFLIWFYNTTLSISIEMPIWFLNICERWDSKFHLIEATKGINGEIRQKYRFKGFKHINTFCTFLFPILIFVYFIFLMSKSDSTFELISDQTLWNGVLSHNYDNLPYSEQQVRSPMCGIGIYHLNLIQIGSIAAASYYKNSELTKYYLKNSFFRDDDVIISHLEHVLKEDDDAVLLRADIDIKKSSRNLTIFSVRGSTTSIDWWLDFEIFISAALTSVARWIPILQSYESFGAKVISGLMTFPLYTMDKATLTYSYTEKMFQKVEEFIEKNKIEKRTILFTGHSLGGGLSKVLANKFGMQSVSFSGPGISPIEDRFKKSGYDKYFKAKFIDIVPDNDFVPRFEISGGTKYRVLCEQNGGECHSILRTICQLGVSCGLEYYTGDFCRGRYNKNEYDNMISLSHGHKKY